MHFLEGFFSGYPCLTRLLFFVSFFLFIRNSDLLECTVDHRPSIQEGQSISGLVVGYIFPDDVTRARLPLPSSFLIRRLPGNRVQSKHNAHVSPKQSGRRY
jgi:hypothetical protein